jgi:hypothetical protein
MVASLKPMFVTPHFRTLKQDHQIRLIEAYWGGIRDVLRAGFDDPSDYAIQKGVGVMVLHAVLPFVVEIVRSAGKSVYDPTSYIEVLKEPFQKLEGDNGDGMPVRGLDFWALAPAGAAGAYSSSAGRRALIGKIRQLLPESEGE